MYNIINIVYTAIMVLLNLTYTNGNLCDPTIILCTWYKIGNLVIREVWDEKTSLKTIRVC